MPKHYDPARAGSFSYFTDKIQKGSREAQATGRGDNNRFTIEELVAMLRHFVTDGDSERTRMCLLALLDKSPSTVQSAERCDDSFVGRHSEHHKAGRAANATIDGDIVRFEIDRHPEDGTFRQGWALNLSDLTMQLDD